MKRRRRTEGDRRRRKREERGIATDGEGSRWDAREKERGTSPQPGRTSEKYSASMRRKRKDIEAERGRDGKREKKEMEMQEKMHMSSEWNFNCSQLPHCLADPSNL